MTPLHIAMIAGLSATLTVAPFSESGTVSGSYSYRTADGPNDYEWTGEVVASTPHVKAETWSQYERDTGRYFAETDSRVTVTGPKTRGGARYADLPESNAEVEQVFVERTWGALGVGAQQTWRRHALHDGETAVRASFAKTWQWGVVKQSLTTHYALGPRGSTWEVRAELSAPVGPADVKGVARFERFGPGNEQGQAKVMVAFPWGD